MRKAIVAALAILIVAAVLGGPLWMAERVQAQHEELVDTLMQAAGPEGLQYEQTGYTKGWRRSSAVTLVRVTESLAETAEIPAGCVELRTEYRHGQTQLLTGKLLEARTRVLDDAHATECLNPPAAKTLNKVFGGAEPVVVTTVTSLLGSTEIRGRTAAVDAVVGEGPDELEVVSDPMSLSVDIPRAGDRYQLSFAWPGGELRETGDTGERVAFGAMAVEQSATRVNDWLWTGDTRYSLDRLEVEVEEGGDRVRSEVGGIRLAADVQQAEDEVDSGFEMSFADARVGGQDWGSLKLRMRFDSVAMEPLGRFVRWLEEAAAESEALDGEDPELQQRMAKEVRRFLEGTIRDIEIAIDELDYQRGEARATASAEAAFGDMEDRALEVALTQPALLLANLNAYAQGSMNDPMVDLWAALQRQAAQAQSESGALAEVPPRDALARELRDRLDSYVEQGWVTEEDGEYSVEARWQQGRLLLNGNPIRRQ